MGFAFLSFTAELHWTSTEIVSDTAVSEACSGKLFSLAGSDVMSRVQ